MRAITPPTRNETRSTRARPSPNTSTVVLGMSHQTRRIARTEATAQIAQIPRAQARLPRLGRRVTRKPAIRGASANETVTRTPRNGKELNVYPPIRAQEVTSNHEDTSN